MALIVLTMLMAMAQRFKTSAKATVLHAPWLPRSLLNAAHFV